MTNKLIEICIGKLKTLKFLFLDFLIVRCYLYKEQKEKSEELASHLESFLANNKFNTQDVEHISLGYNCSTSWYLKECGLKKASYPFDWIFSSCEVIEHCIKDRFNKYLDVEYILDVEGLNVAGHNLYHKSLFNHRSPLSSVNNKKYYQRAIERFLEILDSDREVIFYITVLNEFEKRKKWIDGFEIEYRPKGKQNFESCNNLIELIKSFKCQSKFVVIEQYTGAVEWSAKIIETNSSDVFSFSYSSTSENGGVKFKNFSDDYFFKMILSGLSS